MTTSQARASLSGYILKRAREKCPRAQVEVRRSAVQVRPRVRRAAAGGARAAVAAAGAAGAAGAARAVRAVRSGTGPPFTGLCCPLCVRSSTRNGGRGIFRRRTTDFRDGSVAVQRKEKVFPFCLLV